MPSAFEIVKAHYDASTRGDLPAMVADLAPDGEWHEMKGFPLAGIYVGPDAVVEGIFKALQREFEGFKFVLETLLDAGNNVVGIGNYQGTSRKTGKPFDARTVHVWTVKDGKIRKIEQFTDTYLIQSSTRA